MPSAETYLSQLAKSAAATLKPVTAVVGEEDYLRHQVVTAHAAGVEAAHGSPDIVRLDGDTGATSLSALLDELRSRSLFGGKRIVVLTDFGGRRSFLDAHRDRLAEYVRQPARDAYFVIDTPKLNKTWRLSKAIAEAGVRVDCEPLKADKLANWARGVAGELGLRLANDSVDFLTDTVGNSLGTLRSELEKIDVYLGPSDAGPRPVGREVLEELLGFRGESDSWDLVNAITDGDMPRALEVTERLLRNGVSAYQLIGLLTYQLKLLWRGAGALAEGENPRQAAATANVPPFRRAGFASALQRFDLAACRSMLDNLMKADRKDSVLSVEHALEFMVMELCRTRSARRPAPKG